MTTVAPTATVDGQTLADFLSISTRQLASELDKDTLAAQTIGDEGLSQWLIHTQWSSLSEHAATSACALLKENVVDIFAGAWCKFSELTKCARETLEHPESSSHITLADHEFSYEIEPKLKVLLNGKQAGEIPFKVCVTFTVKGIILELAAGCVSKVESGKLEWAAAMHCGTKQIWSHELHALDLPGQLKLKHPISILKETKPTKPRKAG